jgi:hypothetical protein
MPAGPVNRISPGGLGLPDKTYYQRFPNDSSVQVEVNAVRDTYLCSSYTRVRRREYLGVGDTHPSPRLLEKYPPSPHVGDTDIYSPWAFQHLFAPPPASVLWIFYLFIFHIPFLSHPLSSLLISIPLSPWFLSSFSYFMRI